MIREVCWTLAVRLSRKLVQLGMHHIGFLLISGILICSTLFWPIVNTKTNISKGFFNLITEEINSVLELTYYAYFYQHFSNYTRLLGKITFKKAAIQKSMSESMTDE